MIRSPYILACRGWWSYSDRWYLQESTGSAGFKRLARVLKVSCVPLANGFALHWQKMIVCL